MRTEFERTCKEVAVAQFQALSQRLPGGTGENHGNPRRYCRYPGQDSNRVPSEYASEPICLIEITVPKPGEGLHKSLYILQNLGGHSNKKIADNKTITFKGKHQIRCKSITLSSVLIKIKKSPYSINHYTMKT